MAGITGIGGSGTAYRVDAAYPISVARAPRLRLNVVTYFDHAAGTVPGWGELVIWALAMYPGAQYDWRLPISSVPGDVVVSVGGGIGLGTFWIRLPDEPFMPSRYESITVYGARFGAAIQYRAPWGLIVALEPIGLVIPFNEPASPDPRVTVNTETSLDVSLTAGYQFR